MTPITINQDVALDLTDQGFAWIPATRWSIASEHQTHWNELRNDWDRLDLDRYLARGATFRLRRYGRYYWSPARDELLALPHRPYFQPIAENSYAGGVNREFAPLLPESLSNPFLRALIRCVFVCLPVPLEKQVCPWEVRIHQVRIVATPLEPGHPAPEGIHQDGTDFLTLHLVRRWNVTGGTTTIYDLERKPKLSVTLQDCLDTFILEDARVMHGVTPVHVSAGSDSGTRDLLGIDFIYHPRLARPPEPELDQAPNRPRP
jgi:hypothetical protein